MESIRFHAEHPDMARVHEASSVNGAVLSHRGWVLPDHVPGPTDEKRTFVDTFLNLAHQDHNFYRSPARFARLVWAFSTNLFRQVEILRILALPAFKKLVRVEPIFPFKYLTRDYLVRGISPAERAVCFAHHYRRLSTMFSEPVLEQILYSDITLLEKQTPDHLFSVRFRLERAEVREGELSLALQVDGVTVYILQFAIVPGRVVKSDAAEVLLVSRLQGIKGSYRQVHLATKAFLDVAPPALLLALLHGIAKLCAIDEMAGISATKQFSYIEKCAQSFQTAYDDFWVELGATRVSESFFACPIPPLEKPLDSITNGHRARTRKKRAFKQQLAEDVFRRLGGIPSDSDAEVASSEEEELLLAR
jgi:uncharacterized protein VirK/YbjX